MPSRTFSSPAPSARSTSTATRRAPLSATERALTSKAEAQRDALLVSRFNDGDESAFLEIMTRYREKIFGITFALLRNRADAEELTQDTFIRAHRALPNFRGDSSLATWLHRIAVNLARNRYWYYFRRRRQDTLSLDCPLGDEGDATFTDLVATEAPDPAREAVTSEFAALIGACMEKLEPSHREILTLRSFLHQPYDEIAATLGINVGTVKSRIARARENLRLLLAEMCPEFEPEAEASTWFEPARYAGRIALAAV